MHLKGAFFKLCSGPLITQKRGYTKVVDPAYPADVTYRVQHLTPPTSRGRLYLEHIIVPELHTPWSLYAARAMACKSI